VAVVPNIDATGFGVARVDLLTPEQRAAITRFQPDGLGFPLDQEPIKSESLTPAGATPSASAVDQESALRPADLESAGARWETMPAEERHALIQRAGLNPVQRRNVQAMPWRKMGDVLRNRLAGVMQPAPSLAVPIGTTIRALPAKSEAPDAAIRWEAMSGEQRQQVAARAGWATKAGAPNVIARRLAQTAWTDLGNAARDRLASGLLPDPADGPARPPAAPDMQQDIPTSAATPEAAPAAAPAFAPGQTTKGRDVLLAQVEVLKQHTAPADLVADYNQLKDRIADARHRASLKATKRTEAETLASWADNQDRELERLRAQIGFVELKAGTARYKVLNTPENLEAFAQKLKKAPVGRWTVTVQPDEVYDNLETRPGTTEAQRGTGRSALRDLLGRLGNSLARRRNDGADRGAVSLLGARLYDGFVAGEANQLLGQAVSSPADLATLAQVYRDPRFETFRAFFVKNGRIIGENGYSSRLPAVVRVPDNLPEQIRDDMQAFGADGYYLLHNHPSGRAEPSVQDVRLTNDVDQKAPGMLGHIVIDHNEYSVIQGSGQVQRVAAPELAAVDFKSKPTLAHNLLNVEVGGPVDVASIAKALQIPGGHATLVLTGSDGRVSLLLDLPAAMLDDASPEALGKVKGVMRALARESGSGGHRFLVLPAGAQTNFAMGELIRLGVVSDVVTAAGDSMRMNGTPWGGNFLDGRDAKVMRISDEASPYTVAEDVPPRYARDTADAPQGQADPGALPPAPRLTPAEWIGHALRTNRGWAMGALTRDQITDIWGESMPGVRRFDEVVREMDTVRQRIAERADVILERWRELPSEVADRVSDLMHRATLAQFDPETHRTGALRTEQADMLRMWKTLPPAAQSLYRDVRDTYRETLLSIRDGLASRAENAGTNGARIAAQIRLEFDNYLKDGPYFPLARFGELVLIADKGKERIVETFESSAQRELRMRQLRGAGWTVKATSKAEYSATRDGAAGQFIGDVLEKVNALEMPADQKSALMDNLNQLAIGTLPDASYRRHFRHRKGVPGFSSDAMRAFAASMQHAGHHIAKIRHAQELALLLDEMQKAARGALIRTHFDYSASNRARFMHGNFTRVITMFKQYSQQMTYLLWRNAYQALKGESPEVKREARRMLVGVAAMHFTAAGSLGLPLGVFGITPLLGLLSMGMGDEDDPWGLGDRVPEHAGRRFRQGRRRGDRARPHAHAAERGSCLPRRPGRPVDSRTAEGGRGARPR
ncbi:MAG: PLxRFG domain-containing protein, partial [Dokdonella sp.]